MADFRNLINAFDRMMAAVTFAEAGEPEKALDILYDKPEKEKHRRVGSGITSQEESRPQLRM